jgi:uncharacterized cupredoxin-like copper-binding protein
MNHLLRPALGAVLVLVVAACADPSGQPWTPPPAGTPAAETTAPETAAPASVAPGSTAPSVAPGSAAPESAAPASAAPATAAPASAAPSAAPSVPAQTGPIELTFNADGQLQRNGEKVTDIPVTPGETAEFVIVNESGKPHSFYIGPSQSLLLGQVDGLVGIPEWSDAEPKQLSWEVPADLAGLKFASTVGSDYGQTNGTFSVAGAAGTPAPATAAPASAAPSAAAPSAPASVVPGEARVIELELDGALQIKQNGQKVTDIPVTPGETITFKLTNTAGYAHNFWIGTDQELSVPNAKTAAGVPDWSSGVQEFTWVVPDDISGLKYGCTVPGHYSLMQGTFSPAA